MGPDNFEPIKEIKYFYKDKEHKIMNNDFTIEELRAMLKAKEKEEAEKKKAEEEAKAKKLAEEKTTRRKEIEEAIENVNTLIADYIKDYGKFSFNRQTINSYPLESLFNKIWF